MKTTLIFILTFLTCFCEAVTVPFSAFNASQFNVSVPNNTISINTSIFPTNAILSIAYTNAGPSTTYITNGNAITALLNTNSFAGGGGGGGAGFPFTTNGVSYSITPLGQFVVSNTVTSAYFLIGTNGHISSFDQYGGSMQLTTNKFSITNNANSLLFSNGVLAVNGNAVLTNAAAFDAAGAGTTAANAATNVLKSAAYQLATAFDAAGAGTTAAQNATNAMTGALISGAIPVGLATNVSGTLTNNTTGSAGTATNTWATTFPAIWALNPAMWVNADAISGTNGQQITTVPDISGNGANMANATATPVTLLAPGRGIGGHAAINMQANWNPITGANPTVSYGLTNGVWTPGMCTNFSVTFVYQDTLELGGQSPYQVELNGGVNPLLWIAGTNQNQYAYNYYSQNNQDMEGVMQFVSGGNSDERPTLPLFKLPMVVTFRQTSGARDTWINGVPVAFTNLDPGTFTSPFSGNLFFVGNWFYRGSINPANGAFCGKISQIILTANSPSDQQLQSMHQELTSYYNVGGGPLIAFLGDSLTQGTATGPYTNMPGIIKTMIPEATILNEGIGGQSSPMLSLLSTNWAGIKINSTGVKIVNIMDFVNDNLQSLTLAAWETNLINTTINFKNNGWIVNWLTIPSFNGESNTPTRLSANTFLYANSNLCYPGKIVDYAADALMGTNGSCVVEPTLYYSGAAPLYVHWLPPGYRELVTNWLYPVLQSELYGGGSGGYAASYSGNFTGTFTGNGSGLTNLSAASLASTTGTGSVVLSNGPSIQNPILIGGFTNTGGTIYNNGAFTNTGSISASVNVNGAFIEGSSAIQAGAAQLINSGAIISGSIIEGTANGASALQIGASTGGSFLGVMMNGNNKPATNFSGISTSSIRIPSSVAVGSSPFSYTNLTPFAQECYFDGTISAYSVSKNGVAVYGSLAGADYFVLQPTNYCTITWSVNAPTMYTNSW